jgi:hypothetical protein
MGERKGVVECPRCHRIFRDVPWGLPDVECNCHLFCSGGTKQSDCTVTYPYNESFRLGYPTGLHNNAKDEGDDITQRGGYCFTHKRYTHKTPLVLEVDWKCLENTRLPVNQRLMRQ